MAKTKKNTEATEVKTAATGKCFGYVRVSSTDQNTARQLEALGSIPGIKIFEDKCSGGSTNRPQLEILLRCVDSGDSIVVYSMDRLARNLDDLRRLVNDITNMGVKIEFKKEGLTFGGDDSAISRMMFDIIGAVAEFERAMIRERQREGIDAAMKAGKYKGGRKKALSGEQQAELKRRVEAGEKKAALAREFGISRESLYCYMGKKKSSVKKAT